MNLAARLLLWATPAWALEQTFEQNFVAADSVGLRRLVTLPPNLASSLTLLLPRPCSQKTFLVRGSATPIVRSSVAHGGAAVCIDRFDQLEGDVLEVIYGDSQRDLRLTQTWRDIHNTTFEAVFCPALAVAHAGGLSLTRSTIKSLVKAADLAAPAKLIDSRGLTNVTLSEKGSRRRLFEAAFEAPLLLLEAGADDARLGGCHNLLFSSRNFAPQRIRKLTSEFYLPQYGERARVSETYETQNEAARILGHYNANAVHELYGRTLGSFRSGPPVLARSGIVLGYMAEFPPQTTSHEFYDRIGNVTTSEVVAVSDAGQILVLYPRHPLLGGWSASWTLRYAVPQSNLLRYEDDGLVIIPGRSAVSGLWTDRIELRVILPPFSKVLEVKTLLPTAKPLKITRERQWLDLWPSRVVIQAEFTNIANHRAFIQGLLTIKFRPNAPLAIASHVAWLALPLLIGSAAYSVFAPKKI